MAINSFDRQTKAFEAQIAASPEDVKASRALPGWPKLPSWVISLAAAQLLIALKEIPKSPAGQATMRNVMLRIHNAIITAYADDDAFACSE